MLFASRGCVTKHMFLPLCFTTSVSQRLIMCVITERWTESKNGPKLKQTKMELIVKRRIDCEPYSVFRIKGVANSNTCVSLHKRRHLSHQEAGKVGKNLPPKYECDQFLKSFCVSSDLLYCKFCSHNADWKCADTCRGKGQRCLLSSYLESRVTGQSGFLKPGPCCFLTPLIPLKNIQQWKNPAVSRPTKLPTPASAVTQMCAGMTRSSLVAWSSARGTKRDRTVFWVCCYSRVPLVSSLCNSGESSHTFHP